MRIITVYNYPVMGKDIGEGRIQMMIARGCRAAVNGRLWLQIPKRPGPASLRAPWRSCSPTVCFGTEQN